MSCSERTMTTVAMDWPVSWNWPNFMHNFREDLFISSEELYRLIDEDYASTSLDDDRLKDKDTLMPLNSKYEVFKEPSHFLNESDSDVDFWSPLDKLPESLSVMVNPRTGLLVTHPFNQAELSDQCLSVEKKESPKPYHWSHDHDYMKVIKEEVDDESDSKSSDSKSSGLDIVEKIFKSEDEPVVEVWEIDNFCNGPPAASPVSQQLPTCRQTFKKETRRTSTRTAEIRRREQARKISNAVHAVLKNEKAQRTKQYKCIKPKNSVETTPSQSDIEEWYSQPVRPTYTKITKKKTSKGRIDHSESERHRREVLRANFSFLCDLIPHEYLRGEKMSSQISKQKILNGAKAYIVAVHSAKSSYKSLYHQNKLLRERWQKKSSLKLLKCIKKEK